MNAKGKFNVFLMVIIFCFVLQEKCIQEIDEIFGNSDRPCTFQDTLEMKYLERCIMETLRLYPPVPIIARELQEEVKLGINNNIKLTPPTLPPRECVSFISTYIVMIR